MEQLMNPQLKAELDEINRQAKELRKQVDEMKKNFAALGVKHKPTVEELLEQGHTWQKWFAWRPVKDINGHWHWRKEVYRLIGNTYVDHDSFLWYYYGTTFDILKYAK